MSLRVRDKLASANLRRAKQSSFFFEVFWIASARCASQ
jgi:hypothetical protein